MKYVNKVAIIVLVMFMLFTTKTFAANLVDSDGIEYDSSMQVCQKARYDYETRFEKEQILILDTNTNVVIEATDNTDGSAKITIPSTATNITIVETEYGADNALNNASETRTNYTSKDCGLTSEKEEEKLVSPTIKFKLENNSLIADYSGVNENTVVEYQYLDNKASNVIQEGTKIDVTDNKVVQFIEKEGETSKYFELYPNTEKSTYFIKNVDSFEVKTLHLEIFSTRNLLIVGIVFLVTVFLFYIHRKNKKKYNKARNKERLLKRRRGL